MKMKRLISVIIMIMTLVSQGSAQKSSVLSGDYTCTMLTMSQGLPHNFVEDIFRDSYGFVWIANSAGLTRYDGYEFINFNSNTPDRFIKSVFVRKMAEDKFGRLWAVNDAGIDIIDLNTLHQVSPPDKTGQFAQLSNIPSGYVSVADDGNIWIRNSHDIINLRLDDAGNISGIAKMPHKATSIFTTSAIKQVDGEKDTVWGFIDGYVCRISYSNGHLNAMPVSKELLLDNDVHISDFLHFNNCVWISSDIGLFRYDTSSGEVRLFQNIPGMPGALSQSFVTSLCISPEGNLIVSTLNGLNIYEPESEEFRHIRLQDLTNEILGFNSNFINCTLCHGNLLWVGTEGNGLGIIHLRNILATTFRHRSDDPTTLSPNPVNAIYEDSNGFIWVGNVEGGLSRSNGDPGNGFTHFRAPEVLSHNSVSVLTADRQGKLWVGTWGGGVNILDRDNPRKPATVIRSTSDDRHKMDYIGTLAYDPYNNAVWIGANLGIYIYDIATGIVSVPFKDAENARGSVSAVLAAYGKLWMGGLEGLYEIDLRHPAGTPFKVRRFPYKLDNPDTKVFEKITALSIAHDGTLWIGTNGNGIYRHLIKDGKDHFENFNTSNGLPNDVAHGIVEDPHGNIWVATYHGLACLKHDSRILSFGCSNGLDTEQFYWNASLRLANGKMLFGSIDGLLSVKGLPANDNQNPFNVYFTSLTTEGGTFYNPTRGDARIHESEKAFEVAFSSLDFTGTRHGYFLYRLNGFEDGWKELPSGRNSVSYTNISPGKYSLEVKYVSPGQSEISAPSASFSIEIIPYFYKQWWFIMLVAFLILAIIWACYRWRVKDLTRQRNQLREAVDEGVKEISLQKNLVEEHARELWTQNEALKQRNEQISEQKAQLTEMNRKVQKMTVDRIAFFTNITHEFRTPITLIIGPIERALKLSTNPKVIEQLNFVERNSKYLLSLINQLMDFRKVEAGKMEILPTRSNFWRFIDEVVPPFKAYAEERNITIRTVIHLQSDEFCYDREAIRKVLTNLLGNAIKFTPDHGTVTIYAALFRSNRCRQPNTLYLCVSDTGNGIADGDIDRIFDRYYQGKSEIKFPLVGAADTGIGLYLCKQIMEVYGGNISVRNNPGAGCSFRVLVGVPDEDIKFESEDAAPDLKMIAGKPQDTNASGNRLNVLVVEDNSDMRSFIRSILSDTYDVTEAADGEKALEILNSTHIDLIISDLMMPGMDGVKLSQMVKENFSISHIPFIMLTAKTAREARLDSYRSGVDEYILKPFDEEMLLARIRNILDNKRRYQRQFMTDMDAEQLRMKEESVDKKFVDKVLEVMRDNYQNSYFEVGDFAEALGVSRSLLNKKLQNILGESPNQFIRSYRLKMAREMILKNRKTRIMNISEIAFEVGFNDSKYFTRCFTKEFGMNPSTMLKEDF